MRLPIDCFSDKGSPVTTSMKITKNYLATGVFYINFDLFM